MKLSEEESQKGRDLYSTNILRRYGQVGERRRCHMQACGKTKDISKEKWCDTPSTCKRKEKEKAGEKDDGWD